MEQSLKEIAAVLGGTVRGDEAVMISGIGSLDDAVPGQITFLANLKYADKVASTRASAVILPPGADRRGRDAVEVASPYLAFAKLLTLFHVRPCAPRGVMEGAWIGTGVTMGEDVTIFPGVSVGEGVTIGSRVVLHPGVVLYEGVILGDDVTLHANVSVRERCRIGNRVIIHNGTVIGSDGFGYAPEGPGYCKIPQIGSVVVEDDVEIGANAAVDRAALGVTVIGRGTKIDNLVQIAHNCIIGEHCMIISQSGISGSTRLGSHVTLGGQVGLAGHLTVGDNAMVGAKSGVHGNVAAGTIVTGIPAFPHKEWLRAAMVMPKLPEMRRSVLSLEKKLAGLEARLAAAEEGNG